MHFDLSLIVFILGLIIGSFLNVCIYRIPKGLSIITPGSFCPICRHPLSWKDNIPILSFLFLKGRCRYCGGKISYQYPIVELVTGSIFLLFYLKFGLTLSFFIYIIIFSLLFVSMFIDLRYMVLPDSLIIPSIILSGINAFLYGFPYNLLAGGIFALIFYILRVIFKEGLGLGDIELIVIISMMLGFYDTLLVTIISSLGGSIYGLYLIKKGRAQLRTRIPFGPFLISSFIIVSLGNGLIFYPLH